MGDIVHTFPSLTLIKNKFPESNIHWLVDKNFSSQSAEEFIKKIKN